MVRKIFYVALVAAFVMGCSSDDSDDNNNNSNSNAAEIAAIETQAEAGTWRVASYIDDGQDETSDFNGYNFTFESNGSVSFSNGTVTYTGTWSVTDSSNSSDDSSSDDDIDFNINLSVPVDSDFEDLNDDWDIVSHTSTVIELIDISGGNGGTDTLRLERN